MISWIYIFAAYHLVIMLRFVDKTHENLNPTKITNHTVLKAKGAQEICQMACEPSVNNRASRGEYPTLYRVVTNDSVKSKGSFPA